MTCSCVNVSPGSYANQELVDLPWGGQAGVDRCILPDVRELWAAGVRTIESCCGHGRGVGYIAAPGYEEAMVAAGYKPDTRTEAPGCFQWPR